MRLNGIQAQPGTLIGLDMRAQRFIAVHEADERPTTEMKIEIPIESQYNRAQRRALRRWGLG